MNPNEKPSSMPLKEWLIKKVSQKLLTNEKITEIVVNEQFTEALKQTSLVNSIEFSGFGKFIFLTKKATRFMDEYLYAKDKLEKDILSMEDEHQVRRTEIKLNNLNKNIEHLKPKLR